MEKASHKGLETPSECLSSGLSAVSRSKRESLAL
ncbi:Uncharacterised protein [Vibrio cholerae]|nr:Uncharacterised protein [Vibrio cholerae]